MALRPVKIALFLWLVCLFGLPESGQSRIPFREPFTLSIYDIQIGGGYFSASPYFLLDSTETEAGAVTLPVARMPFILSVDLLKYNYLNLLWKQNVLDYQIGLNVLYQRNALAVYAPDYWPQIGGSARPSTRYRPVVWGVGITQSIIMQPYNRLYIQGDYMAGMGQAWVFSDYVGNRYVRSDPHFIQSFGFGVRYTNQDVVGSKVNFGFTYKYHHLPFPTLHDPDEISPIDAINVSNHAVYFSVGLMLGGGKTLGDDARKNMKNREYIKAQSQFRKFLEDNPAHPRRSLAEKYLKELHNLIPYEYFERAEQQFREGNYKRALDNYRLAGSIQDPALQDTIEMRKQTISQIFLERGVAIHEQGELNEAETLYETARSISRAVEDSIARRFIKLHFDRAEKFVEARMWEGALRELSTADSIGDLPEYDQREYDLRTRIANGYLQDASRAASEGASVAAEDFVLQALKVNETLQEQADDALKILHAQNWYTVKQRLREGINRKLAEGKVAREARERALLELNQIEAGMYDDMVRNIYGPPGEVYREKDILGRDHILWVYRLTNTLYEYIYFQEKRVTKVERVKL